MRFLLTIFYVFLHQFCPFVWNLRASVILTLSYPVFSCLVLCPATRQGSVNFTMIQFYKFRKRSPLYILVNLILFTFLLSHLPEFSCVMISYRILSIAIPDRATLGYIFSLEDK